MSKSISMLFEVSRAMVLKQMFFLGCCLTFFFLLILIEAMICIEFLLPEFNLLLIKTSFGWISPRLMVKALLLMMLDAYNL